MQVFDGLANVTGEQTNVYCIDQNLANPQVLYCGTEPGDIFKSNDGGLNWTCVSFNLNLGGVGAVATNPQNDSVVFAGSNKFLVRSIDGGINWDTVINVSGFYPNEIFINPANPQIVCVASDNGFYRSTDGGNNWLKLFNETCYDIKCRPGTTAVVYLLKDNPTLKICEFFSSADSAATFSLQSNGWYSSTDPARVNMGGRLAVSPDDSLRVYAYLIGDSKPNDFGYIGIFRSSDGGNSWTLPSGPAGGPYSSSHQNLAYGDPGWTYHQGFYNCAIMANPQNADEILVGGLNLWRSVDGAQSFTSVAGYVGGPLNMHVDMQDFRATAQGTWITNDGGIYFSNDFFSFDNQVRMKGVHGTEWWGFDSGWNEDVFMGGAYHNGNVSWYQNYPAGNFLQLGGAEPASGYVNRGNNRKVVSSELAGKILPLAIGQTINGFSVSLYPNESYYSAESSEMECHPNCYNQIYLGNSNKLWQSDPATPYSFNSLYTFGTNTNAKVQQIEISRSNPSVIYVSQRPANGSIGHIWRSANGGQTFTYLNNKPPGNSSRILLALSPENENKIWIAYSSGSNGNKIFKSSDGGQTWTNLTTTTLNGEEIVSLTTIGATPGGVYAFTWRSVFYRNDTMTDWIEINNQLPAILKSNIARPFYRDGKIRIGTYGKGVWENTFEESPAYPIATAMVDKFNALQLCEADTFHFEDHSMLNHTGASWEWNFPGGTPSTSTQRNPNVYFNNPGTYAITLKVTDASGQFAFDTLTIQVNQFVVPNVLTESFESTFPPQGWFLENETNGGQWTLASSGGFGQSSQSALFDNFYFDSQGAEAYFYTALNLQSANSSLLYFQRAYAEYGFPYSDTLRIDVSVDCGQSWNTVYQLGGSQLATAPAFQSDIFVPTATDWVQDSVDLTDYADASNALVRFTNIGHYGQAIYLDNINLGTNVSIQEQAKKDAVRVFPNPVANGQYLTIAGSKGKMNVLLMNTEGKIILQREILNDNKLPINDFAEGLYLVRVETEETIRYFEVMIMTGRK
jgi:photosystem II stability/assembly factor-like uncharacterized protein